MEALMIDGGHLGDREQFWRDHVAVWKSLSLRLYSEEHGLKAGTLSYWNSRLKARAPAPSSGPEATFLAVRVAEPAVAMPEPPDERIELALPGGRVVRGNCGFDAATLDRLLDVVERRS
jgi:transposase